MTEATLIPDVRKLDQIENKLKNGRELSDRDRETLSSIAGWFVVRHCKHLDASAQAEKSTRANNHVLGLIEAGEVQTRQEISRSLFHFLVPRPTYANKLSSKTTESVVIRPAGRPRKTNGSAGDPRERRPASQPGS